MRNILRIAAVCMLVFAGSAFAQEAKKDGWWIKVRTQKPESQTIGFYAGESSHSYGFFTRWNKGAPVEFDISADYRNAPTLFILAQTTDGRKAGFCLMYKSKGVRYFEFDLEERQESKQSDEDKRCE